MPGDVGNRRVIRASIDQLSCDSTPQTMEGQYGANFARPSQPLAQVAEPGRKSDEPIPASASRRDNHNRRLQSFVQDRGAVAPSAQVIRARARARNRPQPANKSVKL